MNEQSLEFVTSDELVAELQKRHEAIIIARVIKSSEQHNEEAIEWRGSLTYCLGLATKAQHRLLQRLDKDPPVKSE